MFCTKNPIPMLPYLDQIDKPIVMDVTITGYHKDLEPHVPDKALIIEAVKKIAAKIGKEHVSVRYDPILVNDRYTIAYHIKAFEKLCSLLEGSVSEMIISFLDEYKNVRIHQEELGYRQLSDADYQTIAESFMDSATRHGMKLFTCNERDLLVRYGVPSDSCFSQKKAYELTGKVFPVWKARDCGCVEMADIGYYNSCCHHCKYCYANYDEKRIQGNMAIHNPQSSLIIGELQPEDEIKVRWK